MTRAARTITDPSWVPPHPLGLIYHPAWAAVRDRYNQLLCKAPRA